jgi:DNA-binding winged helix-turn-helix (wHTH) protein
VVVLGHADGLTIDPLAGCATYRSLSTSLARRETSLLVLLIAAADRVVTREEFVERVREDTHCGVRTVDVNVYRLRSKLREIGHPGVMTVYRRGYRLVVRH